MGVTTTKPTEPLKCPRCESTNTKFCYYNNYNKSQPRHFCKGCKRHWTQGGLLRNVPVGGNRKNRLKITSSSRDGNEAGWNRCGDQGLTLTPKLFNLPHPYSANKWHHKGKNKFKITSSSRDGNGAGWNRCRDQGLNLTRKLFNLPCRAPTSGIIKEESQMIVVQSKENSDQISKKNTFDNFLSTSLPCDDTIDNMFKGSIGTIPSSNIPTSSTTSSNIYNYMGNNIDSTMKEESTSTWQGPIRSSVMDNLSNYWNWDDIETLVSADDFNKIPTKPISDGTEQDYTNEYSG